MRSAYEAARREIQWREHYGAFESGEWRVEAEEGVEAPTEEESQPAERATTADRIAHAWQAIASGADPRAVLLELTEPQDDPRIAMHRCLIADATGLGVREAIVAALGRGLPVAPWLTSVLQPREFHALLQDDAFAWKTLRRQTESPAAAQLARARLHVLMCRGRLDLAIAQVLDESYVEDAEKLPLLDWAGQEVLAVAAWAGAEGLDRLDRRYGAHAAEAWDFLSPPDHRAAAEGLQAGWQTWRREFPSLRALRRFFVLAPIVITELEAVLCEALACDFLGRADTYAAGFFRMGEIEPELLERFILAAEALSRSAEDDEDEDDLPDARRIAQIETHIQRALMNRWAAPVYDGALRPLLALLARLVVVHGLSPRGLLLAMESARDVRDLRLFEQRIRAERMLAALHACRRLAL